MAARTTKKERQTNAKRMYQLLMNGSNSRQAVVIKRSESSSNPNLNPCQLVVKLSKMESEMVIAQDSALGLEGCFIELFNSLGHSIQKTMYEQGFNEWVYKTFKFRITYNDGLVMLFER